jgi:hypothetical protein
MVSFSSKKVKHSNPSHTKKKKKSKAPNKSGTKKALQCFIQPLPRSLKKKREEKRD